MKELIIQSVLFSIRIAAKIQLRKTNPVIIGIGGSSGKSSLSLLVATILKEKYVVKHSKGKNSETGIPLNILDLDVGENTPIDWLKNLILIPLKLLINWKPYEYYVVEMGIDSPNPPKNMRYLLTIVQPTIGVLSNITIEHSANFDDAVIEADEEKRREKLLSLIAKEENTLLTSLSANGKAIINLDDPRIEKTNLQAKTITVSTKNEHADIFVRVKDVDTERFHVSIHHNKKTYELTIPQALPKHFATTIGLAIATALGVEISIAESAKILEENFSLPPGRLTIFAGIQETTILDSSYNASLMPMLDALELLKTVGKKRRKVATLGDMRELGTQSRNEHEQVAKQIQKTADFAILIGPQMGKYVVPILDAGNFPNRYFPTAQLAKYEIPNMIQLKDIILVKGSQNTLFLEQIVEVLLKNPQDSEKLCRRGKFWDKKRNSNT